MCSCTQTPQSHAREMLIFHRHKARRCNFPPLWRKSRPKTHLKNVVVYIVYGAIYQRARENLSFFPAHDKCLCVSRVCTGDSLNGLPAHNLPMHIIVRVLFLFACRTSFYVLFLRTQTDNVCGPLLPLNAYIWPFIVCLLVCMCAMCGAAAYSIFACVVSLNLASCYTLLIIPNIKVKNEMESDAALGRVSARARALVLMQICERHSFLGICG